MTSKRPFLIPSPRTPNTQHLPTLPIYSDFLNSTSGGTGSFSGMDSRNPAAADNSINVEPTTLNSTSLRSVSSLQSKASQNNSVWEVSFGDVGSKPVRYGSRGADSEALSMSQKELNEENLPQLAVFGRGVSILPLAFVLLVTAVKDAYEDYRRHRSDRIENNRLASVLVGNQFQSKKWKDVRVGEIIKIEANEAIPCDMVLLSTSDPTGVAYVQTINLDGESNLKTRNIYGLHAFMEIDGKRLSLGPSNIVLRGCELKNTHWALGVAVYAGRETKVMLNNSGAPSKRSRLETRHDPHLIVHFYGACPGGSGLLHDQGWSNV